MTKFWNRQSKINSALLKNMTLGNYRLNIILSVLYIICGILSICLERSFFLWVFLIFSIISGVIAIRNHFKNKNENEFDKPIYSLNFLAICVGRLSIVIESILYTYKIKIFKKREANHKFISVVIFIVVLVFQIFIFLRTFEYSIIGHKFIVDLIIKISGGDVGLIYKIVLYYGFFNGGVIIWMYCFRSFLMISISDEDYKKILMDYRRNVK